MDQYKTVMNQGAKRSIFRWIHIIFALPLVGYIYGPPSETLQYLPYFRFIYFPVVVLSGLWMWKGDAIRRLIPKS
jgi:thiosulfate reductase cytochrome b subunit